MDSSDNINTSGMSVPVRFSAGLIVLSFFVSFVGAFSTVELLHRRENYKGWIKWTQLIACAFTFGFICVRCMAFVANSAMILDDGAPNKQIFYDPALTILSAVVPMIVSFIAFVVSDLRYGRGKRHAFSLAAAGPISGLAVVAMHYIGSLGASNYTLTYLPGYFAGAIIIACFSCAVSFFFVFKLRESRLVTLQGRLLCALILATGVTGMQFEALVGTLYSQGFEDPRAYLQRKGTLILAIALTGLTVVLDVFLFSRSLIRRKKLADRAQQVVLACARFDHEGKIMVTREGMLPCRKMTVQDNQRCFDDDFSNSHEAFQWIFRVSSDWYSIRPWLHAIRSHLRAVENVEDAESTRSDSSSIWSLRPGDTDYSVLFKESFCIAASDLAADLREPLQELGRVFDAVMSSGSRDYFGFRFSSLWKHRSFSAADSHNLDVFGKGQVIFLIKRMDRKDVPKFQSMGYRFMPLGKVISLCADIMQIPRDYLQNHLVKARASALDMEAYKKQPGGVFLACFTVKPSVGKKNWEVLVTKDQLPKLPQVPLWSQAKMEDRQRFVDALDGQSVSTILNYLEQRTVSLDREEEAFAKAFRRAILELGQLIAEPFFKSALLTSKVTQAPVNDYTGRQTHCSLLAFHIIPNIHAVPSHNPDQLSYLPLSFFKCRHQTIDRLPADPEFRKKLQQEFVKRFAGRHFELVEVKSPPASSHRGSTLRSSSKLEESGLRNLSIVSMRRDTFFEAASADGDQQSFNTSVRSLKAGPAASDATPSTPSSPAALPMAGEGESSTGSQAALLPVSPTTNAATFVDELFTVATAKWAKR